MWQRLLSARFGYSATVPKIVLHDARRTLTDLGAYVMTHVDLSRCLHIAGEEWDALAAHWGDLVPDGPDDYAAESGTARFRRYGQFLFDGPDSATPLPRDEFLQPPNRTPLYTGRPRRFTPLTDAFAGEPLLGRLLRILAWLADGLDDSPRWIAGVHPQRVLATAGRGLPTPMGLHRDGVTLVTSLLINRSNAVGGETAVVDTDARPVLTTTLVEPGTLVLSDDRRTLHGVSPIRPEHPGLPAVRDVLVVTFAPYAGPEEFDTPDAPASV